MAQQSKLEIMRAKLREKEKRGTGGNGGDRASFPFWDMPNETSTSFRLLPDGDPENDFWFRETRVFRWKFADPQRPGQTIEIKMPCRNIWAPKTCPIQKELSSWYSTPNEEEARKFYPKATYIYQGFVRDSKLKEENPPENPIRILMYNGGIHSGIKTSFLSDNPATMFEHEFFDAENGTDFILTKIPDGKWAKYMADWARRTSKLTENELAAIERYKLFDLKSRLPARPSDDGFRVQEKMFEVVVNGGEWDPAWEAHFKPWRPGQKDNKAEGTEEAGTPAATPAPESEAKAAAAKPSLERLRSKVADLSNDSDDGDKPVDGDVKAEKPKSMDTSGVLAKLKAKQQERAAAK